MSYGDDVGHVFNLSQFSNTEDLVKNAAKIKQRQGLKTMTALGIDTARCVLGGLLESAVISHS